MSFNETHPQALYFWTLILSAHTVGAVWLFFFFLTEPSRTTGVFPPPQVIPRSVHPPDLVGEAVFMPGCGVSLSGSQPKGERVHGLKQPPVWGFHPPALGCLD